MGDKMGGSWDFVGRCAELDLIGDAMAREGNSGAVLAGAAGVGKTRLANEALAKAARQGWFIESLAASRAASSIPLGVFADLLPPFGGGSALTRPDLLGSVEQSLLERAEGRRLAVAVDDAHLLDDASATLVHLLATRSVAFVLLTVRSGEPVPDPILRLWKDGIAERVEIQPLSREEMGLLMCAALDGDVEGRTEAMLWNATRGNPLFLRELILGGLADGLLVAAEGIWSWRGAPALSMRFIEVIESRLGALAPDERGVLELVAHGEPVEAAILELAFSPAALDSVERRGLLTVEREGRRLQARLSHPLYAEALRSKTPVLTARAIWRRLADASEQAGGGRRGDILRIATARLEAGDVAAPGVFLAACGLALSAFEPALAERFARAAIGGGAGALAAIALGQCLMAQGRLVEAESVLAGQEFVTSDDVERARLADMRAGLMAWGLGRMEEGIQILVRAEAAISDLDTRDELAAIRAAILAFWGRPTSALEVALPILERPDVGDRPGVRAALAATSACVSAGRSDLAVTLASRWIGPARRFADQMPPLVPDQLLCAEGYALVLAGRVHEARALSDAAYREAAETGARDASAMWAVALGCAAVAEGKVATAARWLREAAAVFRGPSGMSFLSPCLAYLAHALVLSGEMVGAEKALAEAEAAATPAMKGFSEAELGRARAWVTAARGDLSGARSLVQRVADQADACGQYMFAIIALHDVARLGDPNSVSGDLERLARVVDGPLAPAMVAHVAALARGDAKPLDQVAEAFAAMGANLMAAEASIEAARAHRLAGRRNSALASSSRARVSLEECEGARTPVLVDLEGRGLTTREREVTMLASEGLANREIGQHLGLSERTIANHLQNAYAKLGISTRADLPAVLRVGTPPPGLSSAHRRASPPR